jgi:predicted ribosome quality control (RQC) complex YloA/Tae2 family protein
VPSLETVQQLLSTAKPGDSLRRVFVPKTIFGPALIEHCFLECGLPDNAKVRQADAITVHEALTRANKLFHSVGDRIGKEVKNDPHGIVVFTEERRFLQDLKQGDMKEILDVNYKDFHPMNFLQFRSLQVRTKESTETKENKKEGKTDYLMQFSSFDETVDFYFSSVKGQKLDSRQRQLEKEALMKLERVRLDHEKRLEELAAAQKRDERKADLILGNSDLVESALSFIRGALSKKMAWPDIQKLVDEETAEGDKVASKIKKLDLAHNCFSIELEDPYEEEGTPEKQVLSIDIDLSSFANARRYHDHRKYAATKEEKTIQSSEKALKSAHIKTQKTLKEVAVKTSISKARKVYWFEKFFWCISSENYLMIAGRDAQQNDLVVKRYMKPGDIYVHADLHGAASVIIKNNDPSQEIPPRTLEEAATMANCYSSAWDAKIVTKSWWVRPEQVSKTAPSGEYLSVGAFMIRGKKNYLPMTQLILGFGFLFKVDDDSISRHLNDRTIKGIESLTSSETQEEEQEIEVDDDVEEDGEESTFPDTKIRTINNQISVMSQEGEEGEEVTVVKSAEPKSKKQYQAQKARKQQREANKNEKPTGNDKNKFDQMHIIDGSQPLKRGQKSKLKKIKAKYQDQDEEDRLAALTRLGKLGPQRQTGKKKNSVQLEDDKKSKPRDTKSKEIVLNPIETDDSHVQQDDSIEVKALSEQELVTELTENVQEDLEEEEEDEDDETESKSSTSRHDGHLKLLHSLTGKPHPEDEILFCIPVVGPYTCMSNYKFKVKVTPGNNRRGKAGKTALHLFTLDKNISRREKDLLKSAKDMDVSKNLPAKIKISTAGTSSFKGGAK